MRTRHVLLGCVVFLLSTFLSPASTIDLGAPGVYHEYVTHGPGNGERNVVFDVLTTFTIASAGINFEPVSPYGATEISADIWDVIPGAANYGIGTRNNHLASGLLSTVPVTCPGGPTTECLSFYDVPINFTFQAGTRYALGFSAVAPDPPGWRSDDSGHNYMDLYLFDPYWSVEYHWPTWQPYEVAGLITVLDGGFDADFHNQGLPHVRMDVDPTDPVPEPATLPLVGAGLLGLLVFVCSRPRG